MNENTAKVLVKVRLFLWLIVGVTIIAVSIMMWTQRQAIMDAGFGGPFELQSSLGGDFTRDDLVGTPSIILFGFTSCPDVCPTTLTQMVQWREELNLQTGELNIIFVSIDPDRDDNQKMVEYLANYPSKIIGLTGSVEQVEAAKLSFGIFAEKLFDPSASEEEQANYDMDHTASIMMYDREGQFQGTINFEDEFPDFLNKINNLTRNM